MPSSYAKRVLVPVANPKTAMELIRLADHLLPDQEDSGKVMAVYITVSGKKPYPDALENIKQIIDQAKKDGIPVELHERNALSIARGILDAGRELNTDIIVMGYQTATHNRNSLSTVIEEVGGVSPSDLMIYRAKGDAAFEQILVPVRGNSPHSQVALKQGQLLATTYQLPITALHVMTQHYLPEEEGQEQLKQALELIHPIDRTQIETKLARGTAIADEIVNQADEKTLVVLGFAEEPEQQESWLFGDIPQAVLSNVDGPVVLVRRAVDEGFTSRARRFIRRVAPVLTQDEQTELVTSAQEMVRFNTNYFMLVLISAALASFGLIQNSNAVIIGAMLVAPLMSPLMGFGVGMARARIDLLRRSFLTVLQGILLALLVSFIIGTVIPIKVPREEMLLRGAPNILDFGVALASGVVAAFALGRKDVPAAIAGVAIAAALMPPICTTGIAIAFGNSELALGSGLLFTLNLVGISLSAFATFNWMGLRLNAGIATRRLVVYASVLVALMFILVLGFLSANDRSQSEAIIRDTLENQMGGWEVMEVELHDGNPVRVVATVRSAHQLMPDDIQAAETLVENELDRNISLEVVYQQIISASAANSTD